MRYSHGVDCALWCVSSCPDQTTSTCDDGACHERRQVVQLETFRLGRVAGRDDCVRSADVTFLIGNLARREASSDVVRPHRQIESIGWIAPPKCEQLPPLWLKMALRRACSGRRLITINLRSVRSRGQAAREQKERLAGHDRLPARPWLSRAQARLKIGSLCGKQRPHC